MVSPADAYLAMAAEAVKATDPYLPFYLYNLPPNRQTRCMLSQLLWRTAALLFALAGSVALCILYLFNVTTTHHNVDVSCRSPPLRRS